LTVLYRSEPDPAVALELAERAVAKTSGRDAVALSRLAEVLFERGEVVEAIRSLERAFSVRMRPLGIEEQLALYRRGLFPRVASCASVDELFDHRGSREDGEGAALPTDIVAADAALAELAPQLSAYSGCCRLDAAGETDGAAECLERMLSDGQVDEEAAVIRLAGLEARRGERDRGLALIEERLSRRTETLRAWETWLRLASRTPAISPRELLARPVLAGAGEGPPGAGSSFADEVRWVLTRLVVEGAVRINCGGERYEDSEGRVWAADCLFDGGVIDTRFVLPVGNTQDPRLYLTHRPFPRDFWLTPGYRIPLPDGPYDLTLHFAESVMNPYPARFAIVCEGKTIEGDFLVGADGFAVAQRRTFRIEVEGGALDLVFRADRLAKVSAIEVRKAPVDGDE